MTVNQHGLATRSQNVTTLKQASNQAFTNERLRPTHHHQHYTHQIKYIKKFNKTKPKSKIKLNEIIKAIHDNNNFRNIKINDVSGKSNDSIDLNHQLFINTSYTQGKLKFKPKKDMSKLIFYKNSMNEILDEQKLSSKLVRHNYNDDSVLYKIGIFNNKKNMSSMKKTYEKNKTKLNIDRMTQVSLKNDIKRLDNIHQIFKNKIHKRYRRQLKFIPLSNDNNNNNLPISIYPIFNLNDNNLSKKFDPILIRKILNVFNDKPVFHNNYHSIKPGEFIIAPTKYIDSVKLIPGVYEFNKNNYSHDDVSLKNTKIQDIGENNFTTGFGESQRTTGESFFIIFFFFFKPCEF